MAPEASRLHSDDVSKFLGTHTHVASNKCNFQMEQYMFARRPDGFYVINIMHTWSKVLLAARAIAAVENPADVCIIGARPWAQRGLLKFAAHTGAQAIAGRFTPGTFTNQIQRAFKEPRLLIVVDPYQDHQAITEASYVGIPVIALANSDSPLKLVDIAIPCNNKGKNSIGLMLWMLAREVLVLRGRVDRQDRGCHFMLDKNKIMPDLYIYRDADEDEPKEEDAPAADAVPEAWAGNTAEPAVLGDGEGNAMLVGDIMQGGMTTTEVSDWAAEAQQWTATATSGGVAGDWGTATTNTQW